MIVLKVVFINNICNCLIMSLYSKCVELLNRNNNKFNAELILNKQNSSEFKFHYIT